jgi:hypothetical protein
MTLHNFKCSAHKYLQNIYKGIKMSLIRQLMEEKELLEAVQLFESAKDVFASIINTIHKGNSIAELSFLTPTSSDVEGSSISGLAAFLAGASGLIKNAGELNDKEKAAILTSIRDAKPNVKNQMPGTAYFMAYGRKTNFADDFKNWSEQVGEYMEAFANKKSDQQTLQKISIDLEKHIKSLSDAIEKIGNGLAGQKLAS